MPSNLVSQYHVEVVKTNDANDVKQEYVSKDLQYTIEKLDQATEYQVEVSIESDEYGRSAKSSKTFSTTPAKLSGEQAKLMRQQSHHVQFLNMNIVLFESAKPMSKILLVL